MKQGTDYVAFNLSPTHPLIQLKQKSSKSSPKEIKEQCQGVSRAKEKGLLITSYASTTVTHTKAQSSTSRRASFLRPIAQTSAVSDDTTTHTSRL